MKVVVTHTDLRIYWPARLGALQRALESRGDELYIVEIAGAGSPYAFALALCPPGSAGPHPTVAPHSCPAESVRLPDMNNCHYEPPRNWICLFPEARMEDIPTAEANRMLLKKLNELNPDVVMSGSFAYPSGAAAIHWTKSYHKAVVIFDDAKPTDVVRSGMVNSIKRRIYGQVDAMLCPAEPWREAMGFWGLRPEQLFLGVDVVDNAFWADRAWPSAAMALAEEGQDADMATRQAPAEEGQDADMATRQALASDMDSRPTPVVIRPLPPPFLLAVGRQIEAKNYLFLLRAYARYAKEQSDALPLVMVGEGPQRENIKGLIDELGIKSITLMPFAKPVELRSLYHQAAALILPSRSETWGLVVNEAMAAGLPVMVSSACGCSEVLVRDGVNGYVFSPSAEEELIDALKRFTALSCDERKEMGTAAAHMISDWGLERFVDGSIGAIDYALRHRKECRSLVTRMLLKKWKGRYRPV